MPKFLCVCQGGNNRSAGLSTILKENFGQEAVAVGHLRLTEQSLEYFCEWADYVVTMTEEIATHIPETFKEKVRIVDVGPDRFGTPYHPDLIHFLSNVAQDWKNRDWKI